jgi:ATP-dependent RNA helicase DHX29
LPFGVGGVDFFISFSEPWSTMTNKKKKKAAPTVNRGFATSSIASKPRHDPNEDSNKKAAGSKAGDVSSEKPTEQTSEVEKPKELLSPEELEAELERSDLQQYIEGHGPKVAKDTQRQMSKMVTDCRILRAQSQPLSISPWISEELLETILDFSRERLALKSGSGTQKRQPDEVWVDRFWTLSKILQDMGVSKERIYQLLEDLPMQEALVESSGIWGLRRSLDVLALDTGDLELRPYEKPAYDPRDSANSTEHDSEPEKPKQQLLKKPIVSHPSSRAPTPSRSGAVTPYTSGGEDDFAVSDLESDLEPEEMEAIYVDTKLKLFKLQPSLVDALSKKSKGASRSNSVPRSTGIRKLQDRIRRIESDMLFNSDAAHERWMAEKISYLRSRPSSGIASPSLNVNGGRSEDVSRAQTDTESVGGKDEPEESASGELLGGMFAEPTPSGSAPEPGSSDSATENAILRDFGKVTGYSPRRLLEDACRARSVIFFSVITLT